MMYGVVWKFSTPESGEVRKLMSRPEAMQETTTADEAKNEGRLMLAELCPSYKSAMMPLAIVEVGEEMIETLDGCAIVKMPMVDDEEDDLEFVDVSGVDYWAGQAWWVR